MFGEVIRSVLKGCGLVCVGPVGERRENKKKKQQKGREGS